MTTFLPQNKFYSAPHVPVGADEAGASSPAPTPDAPAEISDEGLSSPSSGTEAAVSCQDYSGLRRIEKIFGCSYAEYRIIKSFNKALDAFTMQRSHAKKQRGISWELNLSQWWTIWQDSGHWEERGRGGNSYCMSRKGDMGPYKVGNVFIAKFRENSSNHPRKKTDFPIGVHRAHRGKNFCAQRRLGGKNLHLGSYATPDLAHAAYLACGGDHL